MTVARALTALGLLLALPPGHGHAAEALAAVPGDAARAGSATTADRFDTLVAEIEAGVRDLRVQAEASRDLQRELDAAERRIAELMAALDAARSAEATLREAGETAERRAQDLSKRLGNAEEQSADLRAALAEAEARIMQITARRDEAARRAEELTNELDQALTEAAWVDRELEAAWEAAEARAAAVEEAQAARAAAEEELATVRREAETRATTLAGRLAAATAEAERLRSRLRAVEARLERLHETVVGDDDAPRAAPEPEPVDEAPAAPPVAEAAPPSRVIETASAPERPTPRIEPVAMRVEPPSEVAALAARETQRGLEMIVPGDRLFRFDSDEIHPAAGDALAEVGRLLERHRDRNVLIVGHTDAVGHPAYNQDLSERRARSVREYLVATFDLDPRRIRTTGRGASNPIASNADPLGRRQNRRVEVLVLN